MPEQIVLEQIGDGYAAPAEAADRFGVWWGPSVAPDLPHGQTSLSNEVRTDSFWPSLPVVADWLSVAGFLFTLVTVVLVWRVDKLVLRRRIPTLRKEVVKQATKLFELLGSKTQGPEIDAQLCSIRADLKSIRPKLPIAYWPGIWRMRVQLWRAIGNTQNTSAWNVYTGCIELARLVEHQEKDWKERTK